jgi:hypothetical protein
MKLQKVGGIASLANVIAAVGFIFLMSVVYPRLGHVQINDLDPVRGMAAWAASPMTFFSTDMDIILWGIAPFLIVLALRERMQASAPILTQIGLVAISIASGLWLVGGVAPQIMRPLLISTGDASAYRATMMILQGLGYSADHACGWAFLLIGWAALKTTALPRILACLMVLTGLLFILDFLTVVLAGLVLILFPIMSFWLGITLLRTKNSAVPS